MDAYEFKELVYSEFRRRINQGQHVQSAIGFNVTKDFTNINVSKDVIKEFCNVLGCAKLYYYDQFSLLPCAVEEALESE